MNRRAVLTIALTVTAALASYGAWLLRPLPPPSGDAGPPRSDYTLDDYRLVVLNKRGKASFVNTGPYLARNPYDESLTLNHPQFVFPGKPGKGDWTAHSETAWVSAKGDEVRMARSIVLDGPKFAGKDQTRMLTERLTVFPNLQTAHSDLLVTVTRGASILHGTGMNADMKNNRFELLSKVSLHDATFQSH
jgi:lipopolysaccharide export system protein LptC